MTTCNVGVCRFIPTLTLLDILHVTSLIRGIIGPIGYDIGCFIGHLLMVLYLVCDMQNIEQSALSLHN